ncbi:MAG: ankyrin repeat domain-containing protein [Wolbachia sp.]
MHLHLASKRCNVEIVKALPAAGADVSAENRYKETFLHFATEAGDERIMELLRAYLKFSQLKVCSYKTLKYVISSTHTDFCN